jgi:hypothetical protein
MATHHLRLRVFSQAVRVRRLNHCCLHHIAVARCRLCRHTGRLRRRCSVILTERRLLMVQTSDSEERAEEDGGVLCHTCPCQRSRGSDPLTSLPASSAASQVVLWNSTDSMAHEKTKTYCSRKEDLRPLSQSDSH